MGAGHLIQLHNTRELRVGVYESDRPIMSILYPVLPHNRRMSYVDGQDIGEEGATSTSYPKLIDDKGRAPRRGPKCEYHTAKWDRDW